MANVIKIEGKQRLKDDELSRRLHACHVEFRQAAINLGDALLEAKAAELHSRLGFQSWEDYLERGAHISRSIARVCISMWTAKCVSMRKAKF